MQKCQRLAGEATQGPAASSRLAVLRWGGGGIIYVLTSRDCVQGTN